MSDDKKLNNILHLRTKKKFWIGWLDITKKKDPFSAPDFLSDKSEEELAKEMELKK